MAVAIWFVDMDVPQAAVMDAIAYVKAHANMIVQVVVEVTVHLEISRHLHMITHPHPTQVVLIALVDAKTVALRDAVQLVTRNARADAKQLVREHVLVGALAHAKLVAKTLVKQDVRIHAE